MRVGTRRGLGLDELCKARVGFGNRVIDGGGCRDEAPRREEHDYYSLDWRLEDDSPRVNELRMTVRVTYPRLYQ